MLVLSRKTSEVICVGPNISLTVLAIQGGRVRFGIEAPRDVPVLSRRTPAPELFSRAWDLHACQLRANRVTGLRWMCHWQC